jgi:two-component system sensor histidine kinase PhoQ
VRVRVRYAHEGGGAGLTLRIDDDGPGIPADKVGAVLARGVRADATTPGYGIGLTVVRDIVVEAYGGEVTVGASDLGGAAVTIRIPPH